MTSEPYAYNGSPPVPQGGSSTTSDQYSGQQHRYAAAGPLNTTPAAASAALGYGALLHNQQQQRRRRESNALSDSTEPRQQLSQQTVPGGDDTSEDEIESLKRAMGSDLWALQKQRMRREQQMHRSAALEESAVSPAAIQKETSPVAMGPPYAATAAPGQRHHYPAYTQTSQPLAHNYHQQHQQQREKASPPVPQLPEFAAQDWKYMDSSAPPGPMPPRTKDGHHLQSAFSSPGYAQLQPQISAAPAPLLHAARHHYAASGGYPNGTVAIDPRQVPQHGPAYDVQALSANESAPYTYTSATSPQQPATQTLYAQPQYPLQNNSYSHPQQQQQQQYHQGQRYQPPYQHHMAQQQHQQQQHWTDNASAQSNDQVSGSFTDASGFSQTYRAHNTNPFAASAAADQRQAQQQQQQQPQSPTLVHAHSPMMEQKPAATASAMPLPLPMAMPTVTAASSLPAQPEHVTEAAYPDSFDSGYHRPVANNGVGVAPMQEMQEHRVSPGYDAQSAPVYEHRPVSAELMRSAPLTTPSIPIQSLLNSPEQPESASEAIHQHIAKENARFRQNSNASAHPPPPQLPMPPAGPAFATQDSSPASRSSYHSAGFSTWHGRAETVNQDFATAQQSFSSMEGTGLGVSIVHENPFATNAPLPPIPASLAPTARRSPSAEPQDEGLGRDDYFGDVGLKNNKRSSKPISILVQVGDGSQGGGSQGGGRSTRGSVVSVDSASSAGSPNSAAVNGSSSCASEPEQGVKQPGRKATTESLDNVLEYYRTQPDVLEKHSEWEHTNDDGSSAAASHASPAESTGHAPAAVVENAADLADAADGAQAADGLDAFGRELYRAHLQARRAELGSSRYPVRESQISPSCQRTSFSSPAVKPGDATLRANLFNVAAASPSSTKSVSGSMAGPDTDESAVPSLGEQPRPDDSSVLGTHSHLHSLETTPLIDPIRPHTHESASSSTASSASVPDDQEHENRGVPARSWNINESANPSVPQQAASNAYQDIYAVLDELPEPDDLMLPPTTVQRSPRYSNYNPPAELAVDDEDMLQMESIEEIGELSDILDFSHHHDSSEYEYSTSNSSVDSFGEQIEHNAGILSKTLSVELAAGDSGIGGTAGGIRDSDGFARGSMAPTVIHQLSTPTLFGPQNQPLELSAERSKGMRQQKQAIYAHPSILAATRDMASYQNQVGEQAAAGDISVPDSKQRSSASPSALAKPAEITSSSTAPAASAIAATATVATTAAASSATAVASAAAAAAAGASSAASAVNYTPLEIMEYASELEISLAREQEDYYSDNVSQANLDPMILQNLGKAVHQQCLIQRQQLQRRKSNMHLGLTTGTNANNNNNNNNNNNGGGGGGGGGNSSSEEHNVHAETLLDAQYDDYEQALRAMLVEVSQYFTQSGLNLVFPFSAKWVEWLTRHPDRPFPWRKDLEDDGQNAPDDADGNVSDSDASSFGEDPPMLSRPLPPDDVLSKATIPMSMRRPVLVKDFVSHEKRKGINAHWQYYSVINQITTVASNIHRMLTVPLSQADHSFVPHQLAALYQFLGGDFKKYKPHIESVFDAIKLSLGVKTRPSTPTGAAADAGADTDANLKAPAINGDAAKDGEDDEHAASDTGRADGTQEQPSRTCAEPQAPPRLLDGSYVHVLREMMANIIAEALYSTCKVAVNKETLSPKSEQPQLPPAQQQQQPMHEAAFAISTLKGLPTQSIVRYLTKEMRTANGDRRRRGFAHNLSRNNSIGHLRHHHHHQYQYQQPQPPVPPLPHQAHNNHQSTVASSNISSNNTDGTGDQPRNRRGSYTKQTPLPKNDRGIPVGPSEALATVLQPILSGDEEPEQQVNL
ncbi:hypothetical protein LPJ75_001036 [Coemansia sp. RSA 2598]|nr:hypothetical protein LPJ75_001036 [Coemansia sp. RSA 2598]